MGLFGRDFRIWISHGENHRIWGHALYHLRGDSALD